MPTIIPIPIHTGHNHGPISEEGKSALTGMFIILCALFAISLVFTICRHFLNKKNEDYWEESLIEKILFSDNYFALTLLNWVGIIIIGLVLFIEAGIKVGEFFNK